MSRRRILLIVALLGVVSVVAFLAVRRYQLYQLERREQAEFDAMRTEWTFDPNDPNLRDARFLGTDGVSQVTIGFPTVRRLGDKDVVDFPPTQAIFLDMGAQQVHMPSKPDATLRDVPLGSSVKVRATIGSTVDPNAVYIYDILVVQ